MPASFSFAFSAAWRNCGAKRDCGIDRTSASTSTPCACSSATKRSIGWFEWPMVQSSTGTILPQLRAGEGVEAGWIAERLQPAQSHPAVRALLGNAAGFQPAPKRVAVRRDVDDDLS